MTKLVSSPAENGFARTCVCLPSPEPLVVSPITQRAVSPLATATRFSPGWSAISVTNRSEEHTSELQSLMRISYAVFCLKKKKHKQSLTLIKYIYSYDNSSV